MSRSELCNRFRHTRNIQHMVIVCQCCEPLFVLNGLWRWSCGYALFRHGGGWIHGEWRLGKFWKHCGMIVSWYHGMAVLCQRHWGGLLHARHGDKHLHMDGVLWS